MVGVFFDLFSEGKTYKLNIGRNVQSKNNQNLKQAVTLNFTIKQSAVNDDIDITSKFTDINFRNEVYKVIGKQSPQPIFYSDVKDIKSLDVLFREIISSLNGIEYFTALTVLDWLGIN